MANTAPGTGWSPDDGLQGGVVMRWAIIAVILVLLIMGLVGTDELTQSTDWSTWAENH